MHYIHISPLFSNKTNRTSGSDHEPSSHLNNICGAEICPSQVQPGNTRVLDRGVHSNSSFEAGFRHDLADLTRSPLGVGRIGGELVFWVSSCVGYKNGESWFLSGLTRTHCLTSVAPFQLTHTLEVALTVVEAMVGFHVGSPTQFALYVR
jgi:hypothetical protein